MSRQWGWLCVGCLAACLVVGCDGGSEYKTANQIRQENPNAADHDDHDHAAGPHGGAIVELGEDEYHAEVVVDGKTHTLTVYLLGPDAKTATPVAAASATVMTEDQTSLALKASPQEGEAEGKASKFELVDEAAVGALVDAGYLHGAFQIEIEGKPFRGDIDAHFDGGSHDDHDHDHDEPKADAPAESATEKPAEGGEK